MDGALQAFIYYLMQVSDIAGIPREAKGLTVLKAPASPELVCYYCPPPAWTKSREKGQLTLALGEQLCGSITLYEKNTGLVVVHLEQYFGFHSNVNRADLAHSKKVIWWQPKFIEDATALVSQLPPDRPDPARLIELLEHGNPAQPAAIRVIEFTLKTDPEQALLKNCLGYLQSDRSQTEYWVICPDRNSMQRHYEEFNHYDTALRFDYVNLEADSALDLTRGLLRPAATEILLVRIVGEEIPAVQWRKLQQLLVPGGLVLVYQEDDSLPNPLPGWKVLRTWEQASLFQTPPENTIHAQESLPPEAGLPPMHWVTGDLAGFAGKWNAITEDKGARFISWNDFISADYKIGLLHEGVETEAIVVFFSPHAADPVGEECLKGFTFFLQKFMAYRNVNKVPPCHIMVVTHRAAFEVENPAGSAIWGAVRCIAMELYAQADLTFSLVDIGDAEDLKVLPGLLRAQIREQELAVRRQKLWVPRVINIREDSPMIWADNADAYRLVVENPGQITGLKGSV